MDQQLCDKDGVHVACCSRPEAKRLQELRYLKSTRGRSPVWLVTVSPALIRAELGARISPRLPVALLHLKEKRERDALNLLRIRPGLTTLAAACLVVIMIGATVITIATQGVALAIFPFVVCLLVAFIGYGRWRVAPLG